MGLNSWRYMAASKNQEPRETPLMKQYNSVKAKYPNAIILFRVGDFYETFGEDAILASKILGIVLTKRANGAASHMELAGFPHHSLDSYLPKLVRAGHRVAICDQLEDPKLTKTIVKRGVTELVSPGVSYNDKILDHKTSNWLASVFLQKERGGIAFLDISTGEFLAAEGHTDYIDKLLRNLQPSEIILPRNQKKVFIETFGGDWYTNTLEDWVYADGYGYEKLTRHFQTISLKGFGIEDLTEAITAAGAAIQYIHDNEHHRIGHINRISRLEESRYVWLDRFTVRNLEILQTAHDQGVSLLHVLDRTLTAMGGRMLRRWLVLPLKNIQEIRERHEVVGWLVEDKQQAAALAEQLSQIGDLERLISKVALQRINPRELYLLYKSLKAVVPIRELLIQTRVPSLLKLAELLNPCTLLLDQIGHTLQPDPPLLLNKGQVIAQGISAELDELRQISHGGKDYLLQMQQREMTATGIHSLKISYNNVFGYYIEVTNAHKDKVPSNWIRKQTLTNAERYITEELKVYEEKILGAEEKILKLEEQLYHALVQTAAEYISPVQQNAEIIARLDCLHSFAAIASRNHYCKPEMSDSEVLDLKGCRHPVIEQRLPTGEAYISNDLILNREDQQVIILTGPNMSGKSAILRQTALAVLMAQAGSFVACDQAVIGLTDSIYTRVGASDNLSSGESTFMVEMLETASILNNISSRSLILLDEIGRGTSTYDGVSLAWSIAEFLNKHPARPKTLFATHYHELNELEHQCSGIVNYHISLKETGNRVIFLRKLLRGGSEHSFGIHVARMAGIPNQVLDRAAEILLKLEEQRGEMDTRATLKQDSGHMQLSMFSLNDPLLVRINEELRKIDINTITPVEALMKLHHLRQLMEKAN